MPSQKQSENGELPTTHSQPITWSNQCKQMGISVCLSCSLVSWHFLNFVDMYQPSGCQYNSSTRCGTSFQDCWKHPQAPLQAEFGGRPLTMLPLIFGHRSSFLTLTRLHWDIKVEITSPHSPIGRPAPVGLVFIQ